VRAGREIVFAAFLRRVREIREASRGTNGVKRVHAEGEAEGWTVNPTCVARLLRVAGLQGMRPPAFYPPEGRGNVARSFRGSRAALLRGDGTQRRVGGERDGTRPFVWIE
jgi:hypothetical protein